MRSEGTRARCAKTGKWMKRNDCNVDVVLPWQGWGPSAGVAIEVNGPDHSGKKAKARDSKRMRTARRTFEVAVVPANAGHTSWFDKIEEAVVRHIV